MSDWDAARYHRVSEPQLAWGRTVVARLAPAPGERVLDIGCGPGRLTAEIAAATETLVVGLDRSAAMLAEARRPVGGLRTFPAYVRGDGAALPFVDAFDAVFSAATFHHISDHDRLFRSIHAALKPGGRLVAQCGGVGNLDRLEGRARSLMREPAYRAFFEGWSDARRFETLSDTESRLRRIGFTAIDVSLEAAPTPFNGPEAFAEFIACVNLRQHLDRLPPAARDRFVGAITAQAAADDPPFTLDYWRLNISARKGRP
jgi:trans-aconitate 2-methyltransferase